MKSCTKCKIPKSLEEFHKNRTKPDGFHNTCKLCSLANTKRWRQKYPDRHLTGVRKWQRDNPIQCAANMRRARLKHDYGITPEDFDRMNLDQKGLCASCGKPPTGTKMTRRLFVDHDHNTGKVRGLLCSRCNTHAGFLERNPGIGDLVTAYLQKHS